MLQEIALAFCRALLKAGKSIEARIAIIAITTSQTIFFISMFEMCAILYFSFFNNFHGEFFMNAYIY
ncbi:MAG: hypothetical protein WCT05_02940, partial [Lentisphaeria bacterium]